MMICHSVLDTESKIQRKEWIPAFAGMTTLEIPKKGHFVKTKPITSQWLEILSTKL